jgi:hypothetical protein
MIPAAQLWRDDVADRGGLVLRQLRALALLTAVAAGVPWHAVSAQFPSRPTAGQRVRIHLNAGRAPIVGTVVGWTADTLVLGPLYGTAAYLDTLRRVPRASIVGYQPSMGRDHGRGFVQGAKVGAIVGGGVGLALVIAGILHDKRRPCEDICVPASVVGGVLGVGTTLGGIALGAALGALGGSERWGETQSVTSTGNRSRSRRLALVVSIAH